MNYWYLKSRSKLSCLNIKSWWNFLQHDFNILTADILYLQLNYSMIEPPFKHFINHAYKETDKTSLPSVARGYFSTHFEKFKTWFSLKQHLKFVAGTNLMIELWCIETLRQRKCCFIINTKTNRSAVLSFLIHWILTTDVWILFSHLTLTQWIVQLT